MMLGDWYEIERESGSRVTYTDEWVKQYVELHKQHEANRTAWRDREKNLRALREPIGDG